MKKHGPKRGAQIPQELGFPLVEVTPRGLLAFPRSGTSTKFVPFLIRWDATVPAALFLPFEAQFVQKRRKFWVPDRNQPWITPYVALQALLLAVIGSAMFCLMSIIGISFKPGPVTRLLIRLGSFSVRPDLA